MTCVFYHKLVIPKYYISCLRELTFKGNISSFITLLTIFCELFMSLLMVIIMQVSPCGLDVSHLCIILYKIYSCVALYKMFTLLLIKYTYIHTYSKNKFKKAKYTNTIW